MAGQAALADSLWRFSLMVYSRPGVADALVRLQDERGHNVNLILFALWLGLCQGVRLDDADLARAKVAIAALDRDVVAPLRRLRRQLKDNPDADISDLRRRVLALELAAERRVQARLAAIAPPRPGDANRRLLAEANLRLVLGADAASEEGVTVWQALTVKRSVS
jgi:uncharacterized protein (TIGR02444 family)